MFCASVSIAPHICIQRAHIAWARRPNPAIRRSFTKEDMNEAACFSWVGELSFIGFALMTTYVYTYANISFNEVMKSNVRAWRTTSPQSK